MLAVVTVVVIFGPGNGNEKGQEQLRQALLNQSELNSFLYQGVANVVFDQSGKTTIIEFSGEVANLQDPDQAKMRLSANIVDHGILDIAQDLSMKLSAILDGSVLYLILERLEAENTLPLDFSSLVNKWIRIENLNQSASSLGSISPIRINTDEINLSKEEKQAISRLTASSDVFVITKDFGIENGNHHYSYRIDLQKIAQLMKEINDLTAQDFSEEEIDLVQAELKKISKTFSPSGEVWIEEGSNKISRMNLDIKIPKGDGIEEALKIVLSVNISKHNADDIVISVPEESISFDEAFTTLMESIFRLNSASAFAR